MVSHGPSLAAGTCWTKTSVWIPEKKILLEKHGHTDVQSIVASCGLCKQAMMKQDQYPRLPTGVPQKPFDKVAIDLVGPLRKSYTGNVYVLTMIDLFSG